MEELYFESYQMLMKIIKHDRNRWKDILCSLIGRINIVKITILPKAIYRVNAVHIKVPITFSQNQNKNFAVCMENLI